MELFNLLGNALFAASIPAGGKIEKRGGGGTCSGGPWASDSFIEPAASPYGTPWCETGYGASFAPISSVTCWTSDSYVTGIQFTYADGTPSTVYGVKDTEYAARTITVNYATDELFNRSILYGLPNAGRLQHLYLEATNGQKINCGEALSYDPAAHEVDVAAGVLIGAQGQESNVIDSLGFLFLASPVTNIAISNLNFPNGPTGSEGINPQTLAEGHYFNDGTTGTTMWKFMDAQAVTDTYTYTQTSTQTYGNSVTFSITASIPIIGGISAMAGTTFTWTYGEMEAQATAVADQTTVTWGQSGVLQPQTGVDCYAIVGEGAGTYPYTSDVTLTLQDGTTVSFTEDGSLTFSDVSQAIVQVVPDNTQS